MKLHTIIHDRQALEEFVDWLPDLQDNEKFYLTLFARRKYDPDTVYSNDRTQLERLVVSKQDIIERIERLEIPIGRYKLKGRPVSQKSLVLYINPNPRDLKKANAQMGKKCWDLLKGNNFNIHQEALSCIQRSKSRGCFVDFDIDDKEVDLSKVTELLISKSVRILESRGGYHVLVDPKDETDERMKRGLPLNWHQLFRENYPVDQYGDELMPVPGTTQGGFVPRFIL